VRARCASAAIEFGATGYQPLAGARESQFAGLVPFRNDEDAHLARLDALEAENRHLREELADQRAAATEERVASEIPKPDAREQQVAERRAAPIDEPSATEIAAARAELGMLRRARARNGRWFWGVLSPLWGVLVMWISAKGDHLGVGVLVGLPAMFYGFVIALGLVKAAPPTAYDYNVKRIRYLEGWLDARTRRPS
jgi:hypothetical protein